MPNVRKRPRPEFMEKVAFAAMGGHSAAELSSRFQVSRAQIRAWKSTLRRGAPSLFKKGEFGAYGIWPVDEYDIPELIELIGQLASERNFYQDQCGAYERGEVVAD